LNLFSNDEVFKIQLNYSYLNNLDEMICQIF